MPHRTHRLLLLWCFAVLQAIAPFIHAHAGAAHRVHGGFLHLHELVAHADASGHALEADDDGAEVVVAAGLPARNPALAEPVDAPVAPAPAWSGVPAAGLPGRAGLSAVPVALPPPAHTRPFTLAPPAA